LTPSEAQDEILAIFKTAWDDTGYTAIYGDLPGTVPDAQEPWARVTFIHTIGGQSSLASADRKRIYTNQGTLTIQVFAPIGDGNSKGMDLAHTVLVAYCKAHGGQAWFRNQQIRDAKPSGAFTQTNVLIDFSYDELR
jgi:hypothetical protein